MKKTAAIFVLVLFSAVAIAQVGNQASLEGTVTDSTGAVVPGATLSATSTSTKMAAVFFMALSVPPRRLHCPDAAGHGLP